MESSLYSPTKNVIFEKLEYLRYEHTTKNYKLCHLSGSALAIVSSNFDYAEFIQSIHQILIRLETIFKSFINTMSKILQ